MLDYGLIAIAAFLASLISFFSGFGLGTTLMPVMALFVPLPVANGLTAIVHLVHNALKTGLFWKAVKWSVALKFGSTASGSVIT